MFPFALQIEGRMTSIELKSLTKKFQRHTALSDISFRVTAGERLAIVGPSGSGKSTLMRVIAGLESPTSGSLWLDGQDAQQVPPHERNMGMLFQNNSLYPHLTVEENIHFARSKKTNASDWKILFEELVSWLELGSLLQRMPDHLSGGEQQRVALARALIRRPKTLLLDEPLTHLDRRLSQRVQDNILAAQQRYKITLLYVTHDIEAALSFADRILVLHQGELVQIDTADALAREGEPFVREYLELDRQCVSQGAVSRQANKVSVTVPNIQFDLAPLSETMGPISKATENASGDSHNQHVTCRIKLLDWKEAAS